MEDQVQRQEWLQQPMQFQLAQGQAQWWRAEAWPGLIARFDFEQ